MGAEVDGDGDRWTAWRIVAVVTCTLVKLVQAAEQLGLVRAGWRFVHERSSGEEGDGRCEGAGGVRECWSASRPCSSVSSKTGSLSAR